MMYSSSDSDTDDNEQVIHSNKIFFKDHDLLIYENELHELINSNVIEHKNKLNLLITKIITKGDRNALKHLIEQGYKISVLNEDGETAVHFAFRKNYHAMLQDDKGMLLFSCADGQNYVDSKGLSLFHIASDLGNLPRVISYLDAGVDVNQVCSENIDYRWLLDAENLTPLHFAILNHRKEVVHLLLENGADVNATDTEGRTVLHFASFVNEYSWPSSYEQDLEIMKIFVKYPKLVNAKTSSDTTPLLSIYGTYHYGKHALQNKELSDDLESTVTKSVVFDPNLRKLEKVEILLEHSADITMTDVNGNTIFHDIISNLVPLRSPWHSPPVSFDDALHANAIQKVFSSGKNVDINVKNNKGITPIQIAVSYMSSAIVKILLDYNADLSDLKFKHCGKKSFLYPNIVPTLDCVQQLLAIIDLLSETDFNLTLQDNMEILKILIHNDKFCCCNDVLDYDMEMKISEIVSLSMPMHISYLEPDGLSVNHIEDLESFLTSAEYGGLFVAEEIKYAITDAIDVFQFNAPQISVSQLDEEIACMKNIKFTKITSLYDVMKMNPYKIHQYIVNSDFNFLKDFSYYKDIIKGHFAKSLTRRYVEKSAYEYLDKLLGSSLQYPCYQMIIQYLSNEDIWAVCSALFPESAYRNESKFVKKFSNDRIFSLDSIFS